MSEFQGLLVAADIGQTAAGLIALAAYVPQIQKLLRTKDTSGIALSSWCTWLLSSSLATFYALTQYATQGSGLPLVFSTGLNMTLIFCIVLLLVRYQPREARHDTTAEQQEPVSPDSAVGINWAEAPV